MVRRLQVVLHGRDMRTKFEKYSEKKNRKEEEEEEEDGVAAPNQK